MFRAGVFALGTLPWGIRTLCVKLRGLVDVRVRWFSYHPLCPTELVWVCLVMADGGSMEECLISGEAGGGGAWGMDLRRLGCGCGRRLVTDSCCVLYARRPDLSIYLSD